MFGAELLAVCFGFQYTSTLSRLARKRLLSVQNIFASGLEYGEGQARTPADVTTNPTWASGQSLRRAWSKPAARSKRLLCPQSAATLSVKLRWCSEIASCTLP